MEILEKMSWEELSNLTINSFEWKYSGDKE